jgi:TonB-linked SusC/RagA family outer membrane protein
MSDHTCCYPVLPHEPKFTIMKSAKHLIFLSLTLICSVSFGQKINLHQKNVLLEAVLPAIRAQSGYDFIFDANDLKGQLVTIDVNDVSLNDAMKILLKNLPLSYRIINRNIVITKKEGVQLPETEKPVEKILRGMITDTNGSAIIGAVVKVKGTAQGCTTNETGKFFLEGVQESVMLIISFIGYKPKEMLASQVNDGQPIVLEAEVTRLEAVNVFSTGYQNIPMERATGAMSHIKARQLENNLQPNLKAALEGQIAGMILGKGGNAEIRGLSSFLGETAPLIVVDGYPLTGFSLNENGEKIPAGLESLNIDNIESITVLKDAVAASIYGARSSNGVIVVTTKTAKSGKMHIAYKGSASVNFKPDLARYNRASAADYADAEMELYGIDKFFYDFDYDVNAPVSQVIYLMLAKERGLMSAAKADAAIAQLRNNNGIGQISKYMLQNKILQQHNISLSGGNEKSRSALSIRYNRGRQFIKNTSDNTVILDAKNNWNISKKTTLSLFINSTYSTMEFPSASLAELIDYSANSRLKPYDLIADAATGNPQAIFKVNPAKISLYESIEGMKSMEYNPILDMGMQTTAVRNAQLKIGGNLNFKLLKSLSAQIGGSWTTGNSNSSAIVEREAFDMRQWYNDGRSVSNKSKYYIPDGAILNGQYGTNNAFTLRSQLNFAQNFGTQHQINSLGGFEINKDTYANTTLPTRFGYDKKGGTFSYFNYDEYKSPTSGWDMQGGPAGTRPLVNGGIETKRDTRFVSFFANTAYEYNQRYIFSGSIRMDLANFFGTSPRYRYRPIWSLGGTYRAAGEGITNIAWLNKLNLRATYGINGNISLNQGPFLITEKGEYSYLSGANQVSIISPPNNTLRWEKTSTINFGADIDLFRRVGIVIDYYMRDSKDLLAPNIYDPTFGTSLISNVYKNVGRVKNNGIEVALNVAWFRKKTFSWSSSATLSYNVSKILTYNMPNISVSELASDQSIYREGYPFESLFSYRFAGLDNNGLPKYYNTQGKMVDAQSITIDDLVYTGTQRPKLVAAFTNSFSYGPFELSLMFVANAGHVLRREGFNGKNYENKYVGSRWKKAGDEKTTIYPRIGGRYDSDNGFSYADVLVENAGFVRWRDITVTYTLSNKKYLEKLGLSELRCYVQGRNLMLFTANKNNIDPETTPFAGRSSGGGMAQSTAGTVPIMPEIFGGISLKFAK